MHIGQWLKRNDVPVRVVTMPNAKKRQASVRKIMKTLGLKEGQNWEFFPATTRTFASWKKAFKELGMDPIKSKKDLFKYFDPRSSWNTLRVPVRRVLKSDDSAYPFDRGNIGNSLSMARLINFSKTSGRPVLIMEDDICLARNWRDFNANILDEIGWRMVYLGNCYPEGIKRRLSKHAGRVHDMVPIAAAACLHAVLVDPTFANILIEDYFPINSASDEVIAQTCRKYRRRPPYVYMVQPPTFFQNPEYDSDLRARKEMDSDLELGSEGKFGDCIPEF